MKVLFISNDPKIFDETSEERARMRGYAEAIGELHILSSASRGSFSVSEGALHLHPIHTWKLFRVRTLTKEATALITAHDIELVSAQDPFEHGLAGVQATRGTSVKLHIQVHTDFLSPWFTKSKNRRAPRIAQPYINKVRRHIAHIVLPKANGIRVVSERIKNSLIEQYGESIVEPIVIPVAVSSELPSSTKLPPHPFTFAMIAVGRLEPEKRIEDILSALKILKLQYPMIGLFIVGGGRRRARLERLVSKWKLDKQVIFLGERNDARGLMQSAHAFIQASGYEGYGRTLIEAALAKVPIITTDVGIVGEVLKGYDDVLSAPVSDPTALAYQIVGLVEDTSVRIQLPIHAEHTVRAHLESVHTGPKYIASDLQQTLART